MGKDLGAWSLSPDVFQIIAASTNEGNRSEDEDEGIIQMYVGEINIDDLDGENQNDVEGLEYDDMEDEIIPTINRELLAELLSLQKSY